jgi:hypothetical protein
MAVIFGAWEAVPCANQPDPPVGAVDSSQGGTHAKRGLTTTMLWVWANNTVAEFDIADQRSFMSWGYQRQQPFDPLDRQERSGSLSDPGRQLFGDLRAVEDRGV